MRALRSGIADLQCRVRDQFVFQSEVPVLDCLRFGGVGISDLWLTVKSRCAIASVRVGVYTLGKFADPACKRMLHEDCRAQVLHHHPFPGGRVDRERERPPPAAQDVAVSHPR